MTASARYDREPDQLVNGQPVLPSRPQQLLLLLACAVAGAVVGGTLVWLVPNGDGPSQSPGSVFMSGTMAIGDFSSRPADLGSRLEEDRNARGRGSIELHLPDRDLVGRASLAFSASSLNTVPGGTTAVVHAWGDVTAAFGATICHGSFGFSYVNQPADSGGSLQLRCDDESVMGAAMFVTQATDPFVFDLRNGWYAPADAPGSGSR